MDILEIIEKKSMTEIEFNNYECNVVRGSCYWECYCDSSGCDDDMCESIC